MPFYDFRCDECGFKQTKFYSVNDDHTTGCPSCYSDMKKDYKSMIPAYHDCAVDSVDHDMGHEPFVYHTKGQLRDEAKRRGLELVSARDMKGKSKGFNQDL
jgi:putative FmdB family regulatory protein